MMGASCASAPSAQSLTANPPRDNLPIGVRGGVRRGEGPQALGDLREAGRPGVSRHRPAASPRSFASAEQRAPLLWLHLQLRHRGSLDCGSWLHAEALCRVEIPGQALLANNSPGTCSGPRQPPWYTYLHGGCRAAHVQPVHNKCRVGNATASRAVIVRCRALPRGSQARTHNLLAPAGINTGDRVWPAGL